MGSRRYPLDVDGNPIYFVDENGDTVSSGKDIAVYNYAGVGSDPFRTSSLIINAWSGKDGTPFDYSTGSALDTSGTGKGASDSESADMTFAEGAYDPDNLEIRQMNLSRAVQCHELQRSPLLQDVRSARQTDHPRISGHV